MMDPVHVDVITSCAVNVNRLKAEADMRGLRESSKEMTARIENVFELAMREKVEVLVLGAFGCGVFGNNPYTIKTIFEKVINHPRYKNAFKEIYFVIYGDQKLHTLFKDIRSM